MSNDHLSRKLSSEWFVSSFTNEDCTPIDTNRKRCYEEDDELTSRFKWCASISDESLSWCVKYSPKMRDECAVSKKKMLEIESWFKKQYESGMNTRDHVKRQASPFLLLKGPTGSGKSTCVKLMCQEYDVTLHELNIEKNPLESVDWRLSVSQTSQFEQFVMDINRSNSLLSDFSSHDGVSHRFKNPRQTQMNANNDVYNDRPKDRKLILIEEFPNAFHCQPHLFHNVLLKATNRFGIRLVPIVFIISDVSHGNSAEFKLLPKDIMTKLRCETIMFHAITEMAMRNCLLRICDYQIDKKDIESVIDCSGGDIRNAMNMMEMKYRNTEQEILMSKVSSSSLLGRNKRSKQAAKKRKTISDVSKAIDLGGRDSSMTFFHSIGKILYAKRDSSQNESRKCESLSSGFNCNLESNPQSASTSSLRCPSSSSFQMPSHLSCHSRCSLIENPEGIVEKMSVSSEKLTSWLHSNYIDFVDSLDQAAKCIDCISEADSFALGYEWDCRGISEWYESSVATRGVMFNIPHTSASQSTYEDTNTSINHTRSHAFLMPLPSKKRTFKHFVKPELNDIHQSVRALKLRCKETSNQVNVTHFPSYHALALDILPILCNMPYRLLRELNPKLTDLLNRFPFYSNMSRNSVSDSEKSRYDVVMNMNASETQSSSSTLCNHLNYNNNNGNDHDEETSFNESFDYPILDNIEMTESDLTKNKSLTDDYSIEDDSD